MSVYLLDGIKENLRLLLDTEHIDNEEDIVYLVLYFIFNRYLEFNEAILTAIDIDKTDIAYFNTPEKVIKEILMRLYHHDGLTQDCAYQLSELIRLKDIVPICDGKICVAVSENGFLVFPEPEKLKKRS